MGKGRFGAIAREHVVDANDGIIATAGVLEGFAGAGAGEATLLVGAVAATVAGALSIAGAKYVEIAGERELELALIAEERAELAARPDDELAELAAHYERRGLDASLARQVAEQLSAADALSAQLETEHGIRTAMPRSGPPLAAIGAGAGFVLGAAVPFTMLLLFPAAIETWAIVVAVVLSLAVSAIVSARSGGTSVVRAMTRTLGIGLGTMAVSFVAGAVLF
ncbi:VIT1/CCC1 transporter family protein [Agromyces intestinalis]|uniref:VIT1/CCC1 transporter family protein n=1 Tax=Agromyces intestinalis TaxID=2592652 RepID=UPI00143D3AFF|nr:VIT1/CCC1 transporter family protein [Agromyces intestinalis]